MSTQRAGRICRGRKSMVVSGLNVGSCFNVDPIKKKICPKHKRRRRTKCQTKALNAAKLLDSWKCLLASSQAAASPNKGSGCIPATEMSLFFLTSCTVSMGGGGSLLRQRLTITQVTLRRKVIGMDGLIKDSRGLTTPREMT